MSAELTTRELIVNPELQSLLPPLSAEEYAGLEESILKDGCLSAIITWRKTIVDGYNRYDICSRLNLPFETKEIELDSLEHAKWWMLTNQLVRRNLTPFQRAEAALKLKPFAEAGARKNQGRRSDLREDGKSESKETLKKLEELADMSHETLRKAERIIEHNDEAVLEQLRTGQTTINKEYAVIRKKDGAERRIKEWRDQFTITIDASYCDPRTPIGAFTKVSPLHLLLHLGDFSDEYLDEAIMTLLERLMNTTTRKKGAKRIINNILKKYGQQPRPQNENHTPSQPTPEPFVGKKTPT